jgi:positive regulator of sigma E activity
VKAVARVLEVVGERARLECDAASASCPSCAARGGCALQRLSGRRHSRLEVAALAADGVRLVPGARVTVEVEDGELLGAAARTYLPPLVGLLAGPLLVGAPTGGGELAVLLSAVLGVLLGWATARAWLRRSPPRIAVRSADQPVHAG